MNHRHFRFILTSQQRWLYFGQLIWATMVWHNIIVTFVVVSAVCGFLIFILYAIDCIVLSTDVVTFRSCML